MESECAGGDLVADSAVLIQIREVGFQNPGFSPKTPDFCDFKNPGFSPKTPDFCDFENP